MLENKEKLENINKNIDLINNDVDVKKLESSIIKKENPIDDFKNIMMTFDEYDQLVERLESISYNPEGYFPTIEEIKKYLEPNFLENYKYMIWLTECNLKPETDEEKASYTYLNKILNKHIKLIDYEDEENDELS